MISFYLNDLFKGPLSKHSQFWGTRQGYEVMKVYDDPWGFAMWLRVMCSMGSGERWGWGGRWGSQGWGSYLESWEVRLLTWRLLEAMKEILNYGNGATKFVFLNLPLHWGLNCRDGKCLKAEKWIRKSRMNPERWDKLEGVLGCCVETVRQEMV